MSAVLLRRSGAWWVAASLFAVPAFASEDPYRWLERMNEALTSRNYDGTFFHVRDGRVETLRIIHGVQDGQARERLVSLDGSGREFIRAGNELTCILPDKRTVLVERRASDAPLLGNLPRFDASTASFYEIRSAERSRLMGRDARLVVVNPRDAYRYGYRLWIDEKTAMPLKSQLCDGSGRVIEQIVFASLTLSPQIPESAFRPEVSTVGFRWLRHDPQEAGRVVALPASSAAQATWNATALPPGFRMTKRSEQTLPGVEGTVAHLVFSDGVASVSVFVENTRGPQGAAALAGAMQLGSSAAFSTRVDGHLVTAVGEVPANTVRLIASQVRQESGVAAPPTLRAEQPVPGGPAGSTLRRTAPAPRPAESAPEPFGKRQTAPAFAPQGPRR